MIKIGILPTYSQNQDRPFLDTFSFVNNYAFRVYKNGGIPLGILFPNGKFSEKLLEIYDGFIIPGGSNINLYHILTIRYAIENNKPLLGICMGMQAIGIYSNIIDLLKDKEITYENISKIYNPLDEDKYLKKIDGHNKETIFYNSSIYKSSHKVYLNENTLLKKIYNKDIILEPSIHNFVLKDIKGDFIANARSKEGYIEGVEHSSLFILGVEFHPEFENKNDILFKYFIDECIKNKNKK